MTLYLGFSLDEPPGEDGVASVTDTNSIEDSDHVSSLNDTSGVKMTNGVINVVTITGVADTRTTRTRTSRPGLR